jgi:hypothetical protein
MKVVGKLLLLGALTATLAGWPLEASRTRNSLGRRSTLVRSKHSPSSKRKKVRFHRGAAHVSPLRSRLAHMQIAPERITEIQRALINAGHLHGTPTGRWDTQTRQAMAEYQSANGFAVTGLPNAKALMKLGLGPHPLPPDLEASKASADSAHPLAQVPALQPPTKLPTDQAPASPPPEQP